MIDQNSALVGTNLAIGLLARNIDLTPVNGSLLSELSQAVMGAVRVKPENMSMIEFSVVNSAGGSNISNRLGQKSYVASAHDILMDNYVPELSALVASHISFARSVVYKKMGLFTEAVNAFLSNLKVRQAEDFFNVSFFRLHDVFKTQFLDNEMSISTVRRESPEVINFGDALNEEFDLLTYLMVGDAETDELVKSWFAAEGKDKLLSYIKTSLPEYSMSLDQRLSYYLINYLFYRNLGIKQDLAAGLSTLQLVSRSTVNRDYNLEQLRLTLMVYNTKIKTGDIITPESNVKFSHLSDRTFDITLFSESYDKAIEQGGSIDAIFGYIAKYGKTDLNISALVAQKEELERAWSNTRALYASYLMKNKEFIRIELKRVLIEVLEQDETDDEKEFQQNNKGYREETQTLINAYLDDLSVSELENINTIAFVTIAKIAYRYTKAHSIIGDMLEIQAVNPKIDIKEAAHAAATNYITDFLVEQLIVTKR